MLASMASGVRDSASRRSGNNDKVFVITGASSGIGAETARHAAAAGFRLVLAARSAEKLEALEDELGGPERAMAVACDVREWVALEALAEATAERFGPADVVFANAGFGAQRGWLAETPEFWKDMVLTNVYGAAITARVFIPQVKETTGHLLLTSSVAGRRVLPGSLYSCTKWAVSAMGEALRQDLDGTGVRVTLIEPGMVDTPFFDSPVPNALNADDVARAVMYAVAQPTHVGVNEILMTPTTKSS
jgi:NADP-dependent 3-hydroxy acid dehydrogenase YdfG